MYLFEAIALEPEAILGKAHIAVNGLSLGMLVKYLDAKSLICFRRIPPATLRRKCGTAIRKGRKLVCSRTLRDDVSEAPYYSWFQGRRHHARRC